jgi:hypothetical protein
MILSKEAPCGHFRTKRELPALEARHHGFGARRRDDGALRLLDVAKAVLGELCVGHRAILPGGNSVQAGGDNFRMSFKTTLFEALASSDQC